MLKNKEAFKRREYELIVVLLVILTCSVIALSVIVRNQSESIKDTQVLLQELAEQRLDIK